MVTDEIEQIGVDDDFEPVPGAEDLPEDVPNGTVEATDDAQVPGPLAQPREPIDEAGDLPAG